MQGILRANATYLAKTLEALTGQKVGMLEYKLARKDVYLNSANLSAAFQRMLSEPKSKQTAQKTDPPVRGDESYFVLEYCHHHHYPTGTGTAQLSEGNGTPGP